MGSPRPPRDLYNSKKTEIQFKPSSIIANKFAQELSTESHYNSSAYSLTPKYSRATVRIYITLNTLPSKPSRTPPHYYSHEHVLLLTSTIHSGVRVYFLTGSNSKPPLPVSYIHHPILNPTFLPPHNPLNRPKRQQRRQPKPENEQPCRL